MVCYGFLLYLYVRLPFSHLFFILLRFVGSFAGSFVGVRLVRWLFACQNICLSMYLHM